jgi:type III pantothenate kinase
MDRALVAWGAWRVERRAALVADAGTALSLTWVDGAGCFRGGRISAGAALQRRSLGEATALLPRHEGPFDRSVLDSDGGWPEGTDQALMQGCWRATAGAIALAWRELSRQDADPQRRLWLTGGDGPLLAPLLRASRRSWRLAPNLALDALASLALASLKPGPDP